MPTSSSHHQTLFPIDLPTLQWTEFAAEGFADKVCGVVHRSLTPAVCGMPLGGIDTGCVDLETNGHLGYCTIFNSLFPRRALNLPFLGVAVGERSWTLTTHKLPHVECAKEIHYWGHYPIADLEYELEAPIRVGLRAWSPFLPGDTATSNTPAAIFEVHIHNTSRSPQNVTVAMSFPGPLLVEALQPCFSRREILPSDGSLRGVLVTGKQTGVWTTPGNASYVLAALGEQEVRVGGELGTNGAAWPSIASELPPQIPTEAGVSVAVDCSLHPGQTKRVRFLLAWYSPVWRGSGNTLSVGDGYTHMYAARYRDVLEVADFISTQHQTLLQRILAWQAVIYARADFPVWLRDGLINILHLITEDGVWAQAKPPVGPWCRAEDGLFAMNESPRLCPQMECIPCSFYGNLPIVYFFPDLALSTLRGYKAYMFPEGAAPWIFGGFTGGSGPWEMAKPTCGYQTTTNGPCFVDMVDRYWLRTGDRAFLEEFYPSVKKNTEFTMDLNRGADGVISMPDRQVSEVPASVDSVQETEWFEACEWAGMTAHVGGIHLAQLRMAERMAHAMGDDNFAKRCHSWIEAGCRSMEDKMWDGISYLNFCDPQSGRKSDLVFAHQLDGDWMAKFHGLTGVFRAERSRATLETVARLCVPLTPYGTVSFVQRDGIPAPTTVGYGSYGLFVAEVFMLGMTYIMHGEREFGLELVHRCWQNIVCRQRLMWDMPCILDGQTGAVFNGNDYYQAMMLWSLPAVLDRQDLSGPCQSGRLVDRIIKAGAPAARKEKV